MNTFAAKLEAVANRVSAEFGSLLDDRIRPGEIARPAQLLAAMRHGTLNGGKRIRPFLLIESAALFGIGEDAAMPAAIALECIHCYSLIHDDLPAMDDDDLRRGQPTVHKAYDEATAILAGDSLLTLAFELLAQPNPDLDSHGSSAVRAELVVAMAQASGLGGMAGGQILDLAAETSTPGETAIRMLQAMKTGALIRFACEAGAILARAPGSERMVLRQFGEKLGAAFQLADDILDVTASSQDMGKRTAKDAEAGKGTLVSLYGVPESRRMAHALVDEAEALLAPFGQKAVVLRECARFIVERSK